MALKVELKPDERLIVGRAVIRNGDQRTRLLIEGDEPILREKDVLTAAGADSPAKRIYLAVELMYLERDSSAQDELYLALMQDFFAAAPSALPLLAAIDDCVRDGELYRALKEARRLIAYERELAAHGSAGAGVPDRDAGHVAAAGRR